MRPRALTTSVLSLGESLRPHTVAKGVATEAQRAFLSRLGCDALHGLLLAPALPAAQLERWLGAHPPDAASSSPATPGGATP